MTTTEKVQHLLRTEGQIHERDIGPSASLSDSQVQGALKVLKDKGLAKSQVDNGEHVWESLV
jgi:predicted transcriptional regulator